MKDDPKQGETTPEASGLRLRALSSMSSPTSYYARGNGGSPFLSIYSSHPQEAHV